jgi:hypothetical protein
MRIGGAMRLLHRHPSAEKFAPTQLDAYQSCQAGMSNIQLHPSLLTGEGTEGFQGSNQVLQSPNMHAIMT